jgi:uncharacterized protein
VIVYLDTSALVKYYVSEQGTEAVFQLIQDADLVGSAQITYVEMAAALAKATRLRWINVGEEEKAWGDFCADWPSFTRINVTTPLVERAAQLARQHQLRGYDATHLAAASVWKESLENQITLASFDKDLWAAGKNAGIDIWPNELL